ncbi:hypothetical protein KEM54_006674 [Ascosphaera aggregata]|nr:hypothetical protein KEM54_006674 [Ascosphaera aggregata]
MAALVNSALFTSILQQAYYKYRPSAGASAPPTEGSIQYARDRRRIHVFVVTTYLLYTLWNTYVEIQDAGDFYKILGVTPLTSDRDIRSRYRRLATLLHPDKVRKSLSDSDLSLEAAAAAAGGESQEPLFMKLKLAYETIADPTQRFVYDRFGQVIVLNERQPESVRLQKLMLKALMNIAPPRFMELILLIVLNVFWFPAWALDAQISRLLSLVRETDQEATRINLALWAPYKDVCEEGEEDEAELRGCSSIIVREFQQGMRRALVDREKNSAGEVMVAAQRAALRRAQEGRMERKKQCLVRRRRVEETLGVEVAERFARRFFERLVKVRELVREGNGVLDESESESEDGDGDGNEDEDEEEGGAMQGKGRDEERYDTSRSSTVDGSLSDCYEGEDLSSEHDSINAF